MSWKDSAFNIAIFGVIMNGVTVAMDESGYFDTLGVQLTTMPHVATVNNEIAELSPSQGIGDTLFAMILNVAKVIVTLFDMMYAIPNFASQLGFADWFVTLLFAVNTMAWAAAMVYVLTGRRF